MCSPAGTRFAPFGDLHVYPTDQTTTDSIKHAKNHGRALCADFDDYCHELAVVVAPYTGRVAYTMV